MPTTRFVISPDTGITSDGDSDDDGECSWSDSDDHSGGEDTEEAETAPMLSGSIASQPKQTRRCGEPRGAPAYRVGRDQISGPSTTRMYSRTRNWISRETLE